MSTGHHGVTIPSLPNPKHTYRDIIGISPKSRIADTPILHYRCIAWTAGHESAIFDVDQRIHPDAIIVWFFPKHFKDGQYHAFTEKWELISEGTEEKWRQLETSKGMPRLEHRFNQNPFCPFDKNYTGGHFACCKFPQNLMNHPDRQCYNTITVEGRRLEMMG